MNRNILVTAIGGDIGSSVLRCLRSIKEKTIITGCDISEYVQGTMYVDVFLIAPAYSEEQKYISFIENTCLREKITHFLPMSETEIFLANKNKEFFKDNNIKVLINNEKILDIAMSKYKTAKFLIENDILAPETYCLNNYSNELRYPVIIKPDKSCGSKNIMIIKNHNDFNYVKSKNLDNLIVQEYVGSSDEEYTIGVFSDGHNIISIIFKRKLGYGGMSIFVETINDENIEYISRKVAKALNLKGFINIQLRKSKDKYYIFEINPRISSTVGFRHKLGFKDVIWWLDMLDGNSVNMNFSISGGIKGIKTTDEFIF